MDPGATSIAKLEPFLLIAKGARGAAAAKLIHDATAAPGVFVFAELLDLPNIQELGNSPQHVQALSLLQLFAYKTYADYVEHKDALPPLNAAQMTKLKHLSLVTLAAERRILPYADLLAALAMPTVRELEDLIIDAIYLGILRGRLDQREAQLEVAYTMGRDLAPGRLDSLLAALQDWASTTAAVLSTLDGKLLELASTSAAHAAARAEHEAALGATLKDVLDKQRERAGAGAGSGGGSLRRAQLDREGSSGGGNGMDVDEVLDVLGSKGKSRKASVDTAKQLRKRNRP